MALNIYIPYSAARDIHKGLELKYALRSIEKYLTGWDHIWVIGQAPGWYTGSFLFIDDIAGQKETSIYKKICRASGPDLIMYHDDHFLIKSLHVSEIKQWYSGTIADEIKRPHGARYGKALNNTAERLPDGKYFDIHTPVIFNSENLCNINWDKEFCLKSLYCNTYPGEQEFMEDLKFDNYVSKEYIKTLIKGRLFFSTGTMYDPMLEVLEELYPEKSRFEI